MVYGFIQSVEKEYKTPCMLQFYIDNLYKKHYFIVYLYKTLRCYYEKSSIKN
jgi:hypothetical protein